MSDPEKEIQKKKFPMIPVLIIVGVCIVIAVVFLRLTLIGPGLPPNADLSYLALQQDGPIKICNPLMNSTGTNLDFCLENLHEQNYPVFHELSPKSRYGIVKDTGSGDEFVIAVWYFDTKENFVREEAQLLKYLENNGNISTVDLDMRSGQDTIKMEILEKTRETQYVVSPKLRATAYTGRNTTGYFFAVKKPVSSDREDYFIEYYGSIGKTNLSSQAPLLRMLIAENNDYYTFRGTEDPLANES